MKTLHIFAVGLLILSLLSFVPSISRADAPPAGGKATENPVDQKVIDALQGDWQNELKSTLTIKAIDATTGAITGSYRSPSGTQGDAYPLLGWVNSSEPDPKAGDSKIVVSFSVRWGKIGSVTTWNGTFDPDKKKIVGQWLLSRPNTGFTWDHVLAGQDRFVPAAAQ